MLSGTVQSSWQTLRKWIYGCNLTTKNGSSGTHSIDLVALIGSLKDETVEVGHTL